MTACRPPPHAAIDLQAGYLDGQVCMQRHPPRRCTAPRSWRRTARRPRPRCRSGSTPLRCTVASTTLAARSSRAGARRLPPKVPTAVGPGRRSRRVSFVTSPAVGGQVEQVDQPALRAARRWSPVRVHRGKRHTVREVLKRAAVASSFVVDVDAIRAGELASGAPRPIPGTLTGASSARARCSSDQEAQVGMGLSLSTEDHLLVGHPQRPLHPA